MSLLDGYHRIDDLGISCPVCGHGSWCLVSRDGTHVICPRTPSPRCYGNAGFRHDVTVDIPTQRLAQPPIVGRVDWRKLNLKYQKSLTPELLQTLAQQLGVSEWSLQQLEIGWNREAYTFPIRNAERHIVGVQRRYPGGEKRTVRGSKISGVHLPKGFRYGLPVFISEGASDLSVLLDCGFCACGRLSCHCGGDTVAALARGAPACVVGDTGNHFERSGAERLAKRLRQVCPRVTIYWPDAKDIREEKNRIGLQAVRKKLWQQIR